MTNNFLSLFLYGTFAVNVAGCFITRLIYSLTKDQTVLSNKCRLLLASGFYGVFTTLSALSIENMALIKDDHFSLAFICIIVSVITGLLFTYSGTITVKLFF